MDIYPFLDNKYTKTYLLIVEKAKNRTIAESEYTEKHHIIPKCLGGVEVVKLTPREHFIAHRLLIKMTEGKNKKKMIYALYRFVCRNKMQKIVNVNSRLYDKIRRGYIENHQMRDPDIKTKVAETHKSRYGNRWPSHIEGMKTSMRKYGVSYPFLLPELRATTQTNKEIHTCPHCGKVGKTRAAMKRWHFDRCNRGLSSRDPVLFRGR